jgi:hypothetical protein
MKAMSPLISADPFRDLPVAMAEPIVSVLIEVAPTHGALEPPDPASGRLAGLGGCFPSAAVPEAVRDDPATRAAAERMAGFAAVEAPWLLAGAFPEAAQ